MRQEVSKGTKFVRDLGLYAVGNIGSKLVTFLLVLFYTFFITDPAEFGYYDVCLTVVFGLVPPITLQFHESGFRFLIDSGLFERRRSIVSFVMRTLIVNSVIVAVIGLAIGSFAEVKYLGYIVMFGIAQAFIESWSQIARGLGLVRIYVSSSIFNSFAIALFSVLTIAVADMGVAGIFISNISARVLTLGYLEIKIGIIRKYVRFNLFDRELSCELARYGLPLLPMVLFWWVLNSNGIFFIKEFLGLEENGIYAILSKFTGILFVFATIFYQTWQQNAFEQYNSPDRDRFFTTVFNNYLFLLCLLVSVFPFAVRLNCFWLVSPEYSSSSRYLFANSVFIMGFALSSFFELGYQCSKHTARILPGVVIAMALNVAGNYFMVPLYGIYGFISVNILTYVLLAAYRAIDTRKYMKIGFAPRNYACLLLVLAAGFIFHSFTGALVDSISITVLAGVFFLLMPDPLKNKLKRCLK